jgi:hypothetical protein
MIEAVPRTLEEFRKAFRNEIAGIMVCGLADYTNKGTLSLTIKALELPDMADSLLLRIFQFLQPPRVPEAKVETPPNKVPETTPTTKPTATPQSAPHAQGQRPAATPQRR